MNQYIVIFDGNCNLCTTLVQLLEKLDQGQKFRYISMQDETALQQLGITSQDCELGMILIDANTLNRRWQGTAAAEEIGRLLPMGEIFVNAYRSLPGLKWMGDRTYEQIRDNRYTLFGKRDTTYKTVYAADCGCASVGSGVGGRESRGAEEAGEAGGEKSRTTHH